MAAHKLRLYILAASGECEEEGNMISFYDKQTKDRFLAVIFDPQATMEILDKQGRQLSVLLRDTAQEECVFVGEALITGVSSEQWVYLGDIAIRLEFEEATELGTYSVYEGGNVHVTLNAFLSTSYKQWKEKQK